MKGVLYGGIVFVLLLTGCSNSEAQVDLREEISHMEDSITKQSAEGTLSGNVLHYELITLLDEYANTYPDDQYAPEYLDKIHMVYSALGEYKKSAAYGDKILKNYPGYINRAMILESQALAYDLYIQPRDKDQVKYYYEKLLEENHDLPEEKVNNIKDRLKNIDLTVEQMIMQNN